MNNNCGILVSSKPDDDITVIMKGNNIEVSYKKEHFKTTGSVVYVRGSKVFVDGLMKRDFKSDKKKADSESEVV